MCQAWWHGSIVLMRARVLVHDSSILTVCTMYVSDSCFLSTYEKLTVFSNSQLYFWTFLCARKQMKLVYHGVFSNICLMKTLEKHPSNTSYADLCKSCLMTKADVFDLFLYVGSEEKSAKLWCLKSFAKNLCGHNRSLTILKLELLFQGQEDKSYCYI